MNKDKQNKSECECENSCSCHHPSDCDCNNQCFLDGCPCPCHTQAPQKKDTSWLERFDEIITGASETATKELQDFISKEIQKARAEERMKTIRRMTAYKQGQNETISSVIEEIEKLDRYELGGYADEGRYLEFSDDGDYIKFEDLKTLLKQKIN